MYLGDNTGSNPAPSASTLLRLAVAAWWAHPAALDVPRFVCGNDIRSSQWRSVLAQGGRRIGAGTSQGGVMRDILDRLHADAGQLTLGILIQERGAAAREIEQLREQLRRCAAEKATPTVNRPAATIVRPDQPTKPRAFHARALLRLADVRNLVGVSRSTIYKRVPEGSFPRPIRISARSVRWRLEEIEEWIRDPAKGRS